MLLFQLIYLMLPAYAANITPVLVRRLDILATPIDLGRSLHGTRILGDHKTWRGLLFGILAGILAAGVQRAVQSGIPSLYLLDYGQWWLIGLLLGAGALIGDLIESAVKRRLGIASGRAWIPFDQLDYAIGATALLSVYAYIGLLNILTIIIVSVALHFLTNIIGYYLNIRQQPW